MSQQDGIKIYYRDVAYLEFVRESLSLLGDLDPFHYLSVKKRISAIIQLGMGSSWVGHVTGVYFDEYTDQERANAGPKRFAAHLVRFATDLRLLNEWGIRSVIQFRNRNHCRVIRISVSRELACCEALGCELREIYHIKRWLRDCGNGVVKPNGTRPR